MVLELELELEFYFAVPGPKGYAAVLLGNLASDRYK